MKDVARILLFIGYMWVLADGYLGPIYALYSEKIGGDVLDTAGAWAVFMVVSGLLHLVFGRLADKPHRAKRVMLLGYLLATFGSVGYIFITNMFGLFIVQIVLGTANAMSSSTFDGIYSRSINKNNAVKMWSYIEGGYAIITAIGSVIGGLIVTLFSWTFLFVVMAATNAVATGIIFFIQDVQQQEWN